VTSLFFLAPLLLGASGLYLYAVAWSFRAGEQRGFSPAWLLLPLGGAILAGLMLVLSTPVSPASPVSLRLLELLAHLCNILLIWTIAGKIAPATRLAGTLLYAWNPLVLLELAMYANTAGVVISLLLLAIALLLTGSVPAFPCEIAALVLVGLAMRINLMTLLLAPLLLWFMVRHRRGLSAALWGFAWRALVVLGIFVLAYLPYWRGYESFLAITNGLRLFDFANSPLSLVVVPARSLFTFVAQRAHFPPLMQPTTAADMTVMATSFFLFALLYLREMGRVRLRRPRLLFTSNDSYAYDTLFTALAVVVLCYIVLAATVFLPGYIVWSVWVVALRRFDTLSVCVLLLSCSALLYYPWQHFALASTGFLLPVCVFSIPLVYLLVQYWMPWMHTGRRERKKVLK
jgi:hypothetical protein